MFLVDISYPHNALDDDARAAIAERIAHGLMGGEDHDSPEATMARARAMTHVAFHPAESWTTGDGPVSTDELAPYAVTVTVPDAWRHDISQHAIDTVTAALVAHDPPADRPRRAGHLWVNVVGVRNGSIGLDGMPCTADDVVLFMTEEHRANPERPQLPDGVVADPICGMHVELGPDAITVDHDGEVVGFCSRGCRAAYVRSHRVSMPD